MADMILWDKKNFRALSDDIEDRGNGSIDKLKIYRIER